MWAFYALLVVGTLLVIVGFLDYKKWKAELYEDEAEEIKVKEEKLQSMFALLEGNTVIPCTRDEYMAAKDGDRHKRIGLYSNDDNPNDPVTVSTVFLGLNHGMYADQNRWFETMIFGGVYDGEQERYEFYNQAVAGHEYWVNRVQGGTGVIPRETSNG